MYRFSQWLSYLHWYCKVVLDDWSSIDQLLDAPIILSSLSSWKLTEHSEELSRFGLLWRISNESKVVILPYHNPPGPGYEDQSTFFRSGG